MNFRTFRGMRVSVVSHVQLSVEYLLRMLIISIVSDAIDAMQTGGNENEQLQGILCSTILLFPTKIEIIHQ